MGQLTLGQYKSPVQNGGHSRSELFFSSLFLALIYLWTVCQHNCTILMCIIRSERARGCCMHDCFFCFILVLFHHKCRSFVDIILLYKYFVYTAWNSSHHFITDVGTLSSTNSSLAWGIGWLLRVTSPIYDIFHYRLYLLCHGATESKKV